MPGWARCAQPNRNDGMKLLSKEGETEIGEDVIAGLMLRYPQTNVRDQLSLMALWLANKM